MVQKIAEEKFVNNVNDENMFYAYQPANEPRQCPST